MKNVLYIGLAGVLLALGFFILVPQSDEAGHEGQGVSDDHRSTAKSTRHRSTVSKSQARSGEVLSGFPDSEATSLELASKMLKSTTEEYSQFSNEELVGLLESAEGYRWNAVLKELAKRDGEVVFNGLLDNIANTRAIHRANAALPDAPENFFPVCLTLAGMIDLPPSLLLQRISSNRSLDERVLCARLFMKRFDTTSQENPEKSDYPQLSQSEFENLKQAFSLASSPDQLRRLFPTLFADQDQPIPVSP